MPLGRDEPNLDDGEPSLSAAGGRPAIVLGVVTGEDDWSRTRADGRINRSRKTPVSFTPSNLRTCT